MSRAYAKMGRRAALISAVLVLVAYALVARSEMGGETFATGSGQGGVDLRVNSKVYYNDTLQPPLSWQLKDLVPGVDKFFNYGDVKPGDRGRNSISLHSRKNPAYVCLDFINLTNEENGINEPESYVDSTADEGELAGGLEFFAWFDDGDTHFEVGETPLFGVGSGLSLLDGVTYTLADSTFGAPFTKNAVRYVGIHWCAGDLQVNLANARVTCDGLALGNEAQTDSMSVDVRLRAVAAAQQPNFRCDGGAVFFKRGNNGHGNDDDKNDDSNPGASNDPNDNTDDDGLPPGQQRWQVVPPQSTVEKIKQSLNRFRS